MFAVLSAALLAYAQGAAEPRRPEDPVELHAQDSVVAGILLTGASAVYLLFLWVQLERFWLGTLPQDFETPARPVKTGSWQMLALTAFNLVLHIACYRRTAAPAQMVLLAFFVASMLLLASAAHRVGL